MTVLGEVDIEATPARAEPEVVVDARRLAKRYGTIWALRGVDLQLRKGEILAVLGPNGAGKTTLIEILEGFVARDSGDVRVLGRDPGRQEPQLKARIGIVLQSCGFNPFLTVAESLRQRARWYPRKRSVEEVLELVGLVEQADMTVQRLSGGQQRRLDFGLALVGHPEVLFLDEPTTGFDPSARRAAWDVVLGLRKAGTSILLTTHYLDEAQALADRLAVLMDGLIVAEGSAETIGERHQVPPRIRFRLPTGASTSGLPQGTSVSDDRIVTLEADDLTSRLHELTSWAKRGSLRLDDLAIERSSLEDIYLRLTQSSARP
jgi:ABC-2 type transport system ATP-binding protein